MAKIKALALGILLSSWLALSMHSHGPHPSDLHPAHAPCQICAASHKIFPKFVPAGSQISLFRDSFAGAAAGLSTPAFVAEAVYGYSSRAPPAL